MAAPVRQAPLHYSDGVRFGQLIAQRRRELKLSQRVLADRLCAASGRATFTRHELSRYERGVRLPSGWVLAAMANCLDVPLAVLENEVAKQRSWARQQTS
ncbi:helix-turn-helix domain-containing protein [Dactylosporangium sp. NPDC048998]|uniref:helix-turn-helix domain-containing protein n=1 Tax=Dactylosporangium sp. NPDC048998 TaxID=3363976 RepID=UPI00371D7CF3